MNGRTGWGSGFFRGPDPDKFTPDAHLYTSSFPPPPLSNFAANQVKPFSCTQSSIEQIAHSSNTKLVLFHRKHKPICKTTFSVHWRVLIFRNWFYSRSVFTNSKLNMEKTNFEQHDFQNIVVYVINGSWANMIWKLYLLIPKIDLQLKSLFYK